MASSVVTSEQNEKTITEIMATSIAKSKQKEETGHLVVAAIDFGTTFTGFALSFSHNPTQIITSTWTAENVRTPTEKAPTCVLLSPDKEFVAFGYDAEERYRTLMLEDKESGDTSNAKSHYFFERFKMKLYQTKKLRLDTKLSDAHGKELPAIEVFAVVINYLTEKIYAQIRNISSAFQEDEILWVITVPAIWSDSAKQFMRKAASKAGLEANNVKLILEPEAASLYCNDERLCKIAKLDGSIGLETFPEGMKYIVADLGGGTADLSVHEILPDRNLKEIHRADGDALGGILVDQEFSVFLEEIFGSNVIQYLRDNNTDVVMDFQLAFETKKRTFNFETSKIYISIPKLELGEAIAELKEESIETKIKRASERRGFETVKLVSNKLFFGKEVMKKFFSKATDGIVGFINTMRENDELGEINHLLMVGGFSESAYVQHVIKQNVPGVKVIVPVEPSLAVLKGAVIAGRNPKTITERIARYTYGFSFARKFQPGEDPEELKVYRNGMDYCTSVFDKLITKGDILKVGDHFGTPCTHVLDRSDFLSFFTRLMPLVADVYRSEESDPKYSEEKYGCELIGIMLIPPPISGWPSVSLLVQEIVVGEAEFTVRAINMNTMEVVEGQLDFLQSLSKK
ncbi:heat shock 70 kDa protein 12A-like isoform X2 [Mercenaria mercenaria]|nr:heat shock 70 kDa protein 12A-like isoform X2 [Mercenaria mercenaria]XP_053383655.1 heat shock 70 kDa protein 12A-like isoform X2 [Mercenaria mercenaria]